MTSAKDDRVAVTIADVAHAVGTTKSTVSHALSGKRPISRAMKIRIAQAVDQLGYSPNFAARALNTRRTGLVGVLVANLRNFHTSTVVDALAAELAKHGLQMVLVTTERLDDARQMIRNFSNGMVDGLINIAPELSDRQARDWAGGLPVVTYLRNNDAPFNIDYKAATYDALAHLAAAGHRNIAFVSILQRGPDGHGDPCLDGYLAFFEDRKWRTNKQRLWHAHKGELSEGLDIAPALFKSGATAVFAGNDMIATGIVQYATARGIRLPESLSIVGCDDILLAQTCFPALTTLRLPIPQIAAHTVAVWLHAVDPSAPLPPPVSHTPTLVVRQSVAAKA